MPELPWRLEKRASPSRIMRVSAPVIAGTRHVATGFVLFALMGKDP